MDFIVILSVGRSGSTLLQGILNAFDNVLIRGENEAFIAHLYQSFTALKRAREQALSITPTTPESAWFGADQYDLELYLNDMAAAVARQILGKNPFGSYLTIGFKEIRWSPRTMSPYVALEDYTGFIERMFPRSKFILLTRDIAAILNSGWWPEWDAIEASSEIDAFYARARSLTVRDLFQIDYTELTADGRKLQQLAHFVGKNFPTERIKAVLTTPHSGWSEPKASHPTFESY